MKGFSKELKPFSQLYIRRLYQYGEISSVAIFLRICQIVGLTGRPEEKNLGTIDYPSKAGESEVAISVERY